MQQPPYDSHNEQTWQSPSQYPYPPQQSLPSSPGWQPPGPPSQPPKKRRRRWLWLVGILIIALTLCIIISVAAANAPTKQATQPTPTPTVAPATATATTAPTATPTPQPTAKPTVLAVKPTPKPTVLAVKPTPKPTSRPQPTPTPKPHCVDVNNNPWCYNFSPGGYIYYPPSGFCGYFNCIASFYGSDDPGDGYVIECNDGTYSQSGGERGACSYHGGVMRPLYSH